MYFGPDEENGTTCDLMNKNTNTGKNEKIVELIKEIADGASAYMVKQQWILNAHGRMVHCKECRNSAEIYETCEIIKDIDDSKIDEVCNKYVDDAALEEQRYIRENQQFKDKITYFAEIMRIYLKIEWNRTKKRDII